MNQDNFNRSDWYARPVYSAPRPQARTAPQQPAQATQPFTPMSQGTPAVPAVPQGPAFAAQPSNYTPLFNSNGQVTGQTGAFHPVPQNPAMETDSHGVPTFMKKKR